MYYIFYKAGKSKIFHFFMVLILEAFNVRRPMYKERDYRCLKPDPSKVIKIMT